MLNSSRTGGFNSVPQPTPPNSTQQPSLPAQAGGKPRIFIKGSNQGGVTYLGVPISLSVLGMDCPRSRCEGLQGLKQRRAEN